MKFFLYFLIIFFLGHFKLFAQTFPIENYNSQKNITTNQDLSRGRINLSFPLFNIPINDLSITSNLNYFSDSNNYYTESSNVGMNWYISPIGRIDIEYPNTNEDCISIINSNYLSKDIDKSNLIDENTLIKTEFYPIKFNYDLLGQKGYFILDNHGNPIFNSHNKFKIRFENTTCNKKNSYIINLPKIILTDQYGNEFHFGGSYGSTNILFNVAKSGTMTFLEAGGSYNDDFYLRSNYISSLNLTKIVLADKEVVEIKYKEPINNLFNKNFLLNNEKKELDYSTIKSSDLTNDNFYLQTIPGGFILTSRSYSSGTYPSPGGYISNQNFESSYSSMSSLSLIDYINIPNKGKIIFNYDNYDISSYFFNKRTINNIQILDNFENKVSQIKFVYKRIMLPKFYHQVSFLEQLSTDNTFYNFEYYENYNDNLSLNEAGLLRKIIYPNKGYNEFIYEPHQTNSNKKLNHGGIRISNINRYNGFSTNPISKDEFLYLNDDGVSSGIFDYNSVNPANSVQFIMIKGKIYSGVENTLGAYVSYSQVNKKNSFGLQKYYFSDENNISSNIMLFKNNQKDITYSSQRSFILIKKWMKNEKNGNLIKSLTYDLNGKLVKKIENKFEKFYDSRKPLVIKNCTGCKYQDTNYFLGINKDSIGYFPILPYLISNSKKTEYLDNDKSITTEKKYTYNDTPFYWHSLPVKEETTSNGSTVTNETLYNYDLLRNANCGTNCIDNNTVGGKLGTYKAMADNNVLAPVASISTNQNNKKSLTESIYQKNPLNQNQFNVISNKVSLLNNTIDTNNLSSITTTVVKENQLFDDKGNLLQFNEKGGSPTTIIYGYNQSLPIAEIKGATYAQVMSAFGLAQDAKAYLNLDIVKKSNLDKDDETEATLISAMTAFKNNTSLNNYLIVTKTYNPLIGISSESTPTGLRAYYKYDENNQLVKILDHNKNILQEFKYNYGQRKYYNEALTISLFKNDCSSGFPEPLSFNIPANKYLSFVSSYDANEIAKKEEQKINQLFANQSGICTPNNCEFIKNDHFTFAFTSMGGKSEVINEVYLQFAFKVTSSDLTNVNYNWTKGVKIGQVTGSCIPSEKQYFSFYISGAMTNIGGYVDTNGDVIVTAYNLKADTHMQLNIKYKRR